MFSVVSCSESTGEAVLELMVVLVLLFNAASTLLAEVHLVTTQASPWVFQRSCLSTTHLLYAQCSAAAFTAASSTVSDAEQLCCSTCERGLCCC
jgi:hypothetical protein